MLKSLPIKSKNLFKYINTYYRATSQPHQVSNGFLAVVKTIYIRCKINNVEWYTVLRNLN